MQARFLPTLGYIEDLGHRLKLDIAALTADMRSDWVQKTLDENRALAATFGLAGTPALVVGRTVVQGAISRDDLERLIELGKRRGAALLAALGGRRAAAWINSDTLNLCAAA